MRHSSPHSRAAGRRGVTLVEMLIAIFILGIGVISIATLFPVGLTQQRRSVDDIMGPTVANNAMSVLRSKLSADDFFYFADPNTGEPFFDGYVRTIIGDWGWRRPAFFTDDTTLPPDNILIPSGSISIFDDTLPNTTDSELNSDPLMGLPLWNPLKYDPSGDGPTIIITQGERYFPMVTTAELTQNSPTPQYVWDCAFRRFQGKIHVAIFVYRVELVGGEPRTYRVPTDPGSSIPVLPVVLDLEGNGASWDVYGATQGDPLDDRLIAGTQQGSDFFLFDWNYDDDYHVEYDANQGWQTPRQWLLDQNNNVHHIMAGRRNVADGPVELMNRVPAMPALPIYELLPSPDVGVEDVVKSLWYIPKVLIDTVNNVEWNLTPVYVTVREL